MSPLTVNPSILTTINRGDFKQCGDFACNKEKLLFYVVSFTLINISQIISICSYGVMYMYEYIKWLWFSCVIPCLKICFSHFFLCMVHFGGGQTFGILHFSTLFVVLRLKNPSCFAVKRKPVCYPNITTVTMLLWIPLGALIEKPGDQIGCPKSPQISLLSEEWVGYQLQPCQL